MLENLKISETMKWDLSNYTSIFSIHLTINVTLALWQLIETLGNPNVNNEVIFVTEEHLRLCRP